MSAAPPIGHAATILGTFCRPAQVVRSPRTRSGLSVATNLMLLAAVVPWLACGLMMRDRPLIVANIVSTLCAGMFVMATLFWRDHA